MQTHDIANYPFYYMFSIACYGMGEAIAYRDPLAFELWELLARSLVEDYYGRGTDDAEFVLSSLPTLVLNLPAPMISTRERL